MSVERQALRWVPGNASSPGALPRLLGLGIVAAALALAGCTNAHPLTAPYRPAKGLTSPAPFPPDGFAMYQRDCGWCHGNRGQGTVNGPSLLAGTNGAALTNFMLSTGRMPLNSPEQKDALHRTSIYTRADIAAIVAFVKSFHAGGPAIPVVNLGRGNLAEGQRLYEANCAACHSVTGEGGVLATGKAATINGFVVPNHGLVAPSLLKASPLEVAEAVRTGPPGMPVFGPGEFTNTQVDSIARYVAYLRNGRGFDRGGLSLGRIGPVAEGAAAWLVGLGLLLLLVRWIGTSMRDERSDRHGHHGTGHDQSQEVEP